MAIEQGVAHDVGERQENTDDSELAAFHAYVETHQRKQQRILWLAQVGQHAGESEAVDQAEGEGNDPASAFKQGEYIVQCREHDGCGNGGLH